MANKEIPVTKIHSYNVSVAVDVGINAAIIFHNICFWVEQNFANERNFINGEYWTYNTVNAFKTMFPEMTYEQVRGALKKLEDKKYIKSAFLSDDVMDRTKYYAVCDFEKWIGKPKCKCENPQMDCEQSQMEHDEKPVVNNIYNNINNNTDKNSTDNKQPDNNFTDNSHKGENINKVNGGVKTCSLQKKSMDTPKTRLEKFRSMKREEADMIERVRNICDSVLDEEEADEVYNTITHYFKRYTQKTEKIHPILKTQTLIDIVDKISTYSDTEYCHFERVIDDEGMFIKIVDAFFDGDFGQVTGHKTNWNLPHFMSDGVLDRLAQRVFMAEEV